MKKLIFLFLTIWCACLSVMGQNRDMKDIAGIRYLLMSNNNAIVVGMSDETKESAVIPDHVSFLNVDFVVTAIKDQAFSNLANLKSVTIKFEGSIADNTFLNCPNLETVVFDSNVGTIGEKAFTACNVKNLEINNETFANTHNVGLYFPNATYIKYGSNVSSLSMPSFFDGILEINNNSIEGLGKRYPYLSEIRFGDAVTSVSANFFRGTNGYHNYLTKVSGGKNIRTIGSGAFRECRNLKEINLSNVQTIGTAAFIGCKSLESVDLQKLTILLDSAFAGAASLKEVTMPNVESIPTAAFRDCVSLLKVDLTGAPLSEIGPSAFRGCQNLLTVTGMAPVLKIGQFAFYECSSLSSINLSTVQEIGVAAFSSCSSLKSVTIGQGQALVLGLNPFASCNFDYFRIDNPSGSVINQNSFVGMKVSGVLIDNTDNGSPVGFVTCNNGSTVIAKTEAVAQKYIKKGVVNAISRNRLKLAADVNGDGTLSGDDAQSVYNSMH